MSNHRDGITIRNAGEPILLQELHIDGVAAESAAAGTPAKIWTRLALTSDDVTFHRIVEGLVLAIEQEARRAGAAVRLASADVVLVVIKDNYSAQLWIDSAAVAMKCMVKRDIAAGSLIYEDDIADVIEMNFPCVAFEATDRVICIFRQAWRFALHFDFNPEKKLDSDAVARTLGALYRNLKYRHLYDAVSDVKVFQRVVERGWFPFVEIIHAEFKQLVAALEADIGVDEVEARTLATFDRPRLTRILQRWVAKPHFAGKSALFEAAMNAFENGEPIATIKILLTEIEGVLNSAHKNVRGEGAKTRDLLAFAIASAEHRAGGSDTLLFPPYFAKYLAEQTFARFDPISEDGTAGSRHAVGHGAAATRTYTMLRALQAILTMDQLAFYI